MPVSNFDFEGARRAGYSDTEIISYLTQQSERPTPTNSTFDWEGARKAGYSDDEITVYLGQQSSAPPNEAKPNIIDAVRSGAAGIVDGVGETLQQFTPAQDTARFLKDTAQTIAPTSNYESPAVITKDGVKWENIVPGAAEMAPGLAATVTAARAGARMGIPGALAGVGAVALMALGRNAKTRAQNETGNPDAEPTPKDKAIGALTTIPEAALGAIAASRFLPKAGSVSSVGSRGVIDSAKELGKTAAIEGAVSGAQDVVTETGTALGTQRGVDLDPYSIVDAAVKGAATGGALGMRKAATDAVNSIRFRNLGNNPEAATAVANRLNQAAEGNLENPKVAYEAVRESQRDIRTELRNAFSAYRRQAEEVSAETTNAITRARAGSKLTRGDIAALEDLSDTSEGAAVSALARQAATLAELKETGHFNSERGKFTGGTAARLERTFPRFFSPTSTALSAAATGLGLPLMLPGSQHALAAAYGTYAGSRALDHLLGLRSPAATFVERFAKPEAGGPVRPVRTNATEIAPEITPQPWGPPKRQATSVPLFSASNAVTARNAIRKLETTKDSGGSPNERIGGTSEGEAPFFSDLRFTKVNDQDREIARQAAKEFAGSRDNVAPIVVQRYESSTANRQARIRDRLIEASGDERFPSDDTAFMEALDGIRSIRSREALATYIDDVAQRFPEHATMAQRYFGAQWARTVWNASARKR